MYLKKHTVLQKCCSQRNIIDMGVTFSQASKKSYKTSTKKQFDKEHLVGCPFFFQKLGPGTELPPHILHGVFFFCFLIIIIYLWRRDSETYLQLNSTVRLWNWTGTANLFWVFGKHFAGFFFFLVLHHFISPCNFNALNEKCIISHTSLKKKKKTRKTSFCIKRYICHISPCSTVSKPFCQKIKYYEH